MDFPFITTGTFSILIAPDPLLCRVLEAPLRQERQRVLYICGNHSRVLSQLDRRCPAFYIRRSFTVFQLLGILEEADEACIVLEHDRSIYDDAPELIPAVACALVDRAELATVVLIAPAFDPVLDMICGWAGRVVYVEDNAKRRPDLERGHAALLPRQTTLEAF
ncbi:MAG: hypothetical protein RQ758_02805 [Methanomicrobiaceae archaeon]|nr:hypothetical protein [Methanomicrobiaceae archaeon]